jgi:hypothetical protein
MFFWGSLVSRLLGSITGEFPFLKSLSGNGESLLLIELILLVPDSESLSDESGSEEHTVSSFFFGSNYVAFPCFLSSNCKFGNDLT